MAPGSRSPLRLQGQSAAGVVLQHLLERIAAGRGHFAGLPQPALERGGEFAEAFDLIGAADGERRGDAHAHAFQRFPSRRAAHPHPRFDPRNRRAEAFEVARRDRGQPAALAAQFPFGDLAAHAVALAGLRDFAVIGVGVESERNEHGIRGRRIAVAAILQEEPAQALAEIGGDHAFHRDRPPHQRTGRAGALDLADGDDVGIPGPGHRGAGQQGGSEQGAAKGHGDVWRIVEPDMIASGDDG